MDINLDVFNYPDLESVTTENGRIYTGTEGLSYPSVTTVLGKTADKDFLVKWKKRVGEKQAEKQTKLASLRGNGMHDICERFVVGETINPLKEESAGFILFQQLKPIITEGVTNIVGVEAPLWSHELKIAGKSDLICRFRGKRSIVDYKTSRRTKKKEWVIDYFLQSTIYAICFRELFGVSIDQIAILIANEDCPIPSVFVEQVKDWEPLARARVAQYYS